MNKAYILLLLLLVPSVMASGVTREIAKDDIRAEGSAYHPWYMDTEITLKVTIDDDQPYYYIIENLPDGIEVISSDLFVINSKLLAIQVVGDLQNKTYTYKIRDATSVERGVRFYGYYKFGTQFLDDPKFIDGEPLLGITTVECNTQADLNGDRMIDKKELSKFRSRARNGEITLNEYGQAWKYYNEGYGC
jgi:hypothetical protein